MFLSAFPLRRLGLENVEMYFLSVSEETLLLWVNLVFRRGTSYLLALLKGIGFKY